MYLCCSIGNVEANAHYCSQPKHHHYSQHKIAFLCAMPLENILIMLRFHTMKLVTNWALPRLRS